MKNLIFYCYLFIFLPLLILKGNNTSSLQEYILKEDSTSKNQTKIERSALSPVLKWLEINDKNYENSYSQTGDIIKKEVNQETWIAIMKQVREPLGEVLLRKNTNVEYSEYISQFPKGSYAILDFETSFENGRRNEFIICQLVDEKNWQVITYRIFEEKL